MIAIQSSWTSDKTGPDMNRSERRRAAKLSKVASAPSTTRKPAPTPATVLPTLTDELQQLINMGKQHHAAGDLSKAVELYAQILKTEPNQPEALYLIGVAFLQAGQADKAIEFLNKSLSVFPNNPETFNNLAVAYNAAGNTADAEKCYRQAISLRPEYAAAHKNLGAILASKGELDAALKCYQSSIQHTPNLVEAHKAIADIFLMKQKYDDAAEAYFRANALAPMDADILTSLGTSLQLLSRHQEALKFHSQAVNIAPDDNRHWTAFGDCVSSMSFSDTNSDLEASLLKLLEKREISPAALIFPIVSALLHHKELSALLTRTDTLSSGDPKLLAQLKALTTSELFMSLMKHVPIADLRIERLLKVTRQILLEKALQGQDLQNETPFVAALAQQCFINEYAYNLDDQERSNVELLKQKVENLLQEKQRVEPCLWLLVGCYEPLSSISWITKITQPETTTVTQEVYDLQVTAPAKEKAISEEIPVLTDMVDATSQAVRAQYEENPYPRWIHTSRLTPKPIKDVLCYPPLSFELGNYIPPSSIETLVAGCGTGQHAIQAAARFTNAKVTAVDLSLSSLSYAQRKTSELGITNLEYIQADILELDKIGKQFDIIECGGVLHHMASPIKGWRVLVNLLRDGGLMKIGLYSEQGRPDIIAAREFIEKGGYGSSATEMRRCRQDIIAAAEKGDQKLIQLCMRSDFYSLSPCRDLIFHVQEHRFTIPEIADALKQLGLEFIGFETPTPHTLVQFRKENPSCPKGLELDRWHQFEQRNPDTFRGMYQFWCRKTGR